MKKNTTRGEREGGNEPSMSVFSIIYTLKGPVPIHKKRGHALLFPHPQMFRLVADKIHDDSFVIVQYVTSIA